MENITAVNIAEGLEEAESEEQYIEAWQHVIDSGLAWKLQGFFGRNAIALIRCGICNPPSGYTLGSDGRLVKTH